MITLIFINFKFHESIKMEICANASKTLQNYVFVNIFSDQPLIGIVT